MLWFLRLFRQYRSMAQLAAARAAVIVVGEERISKLEIRIAGLIDEIDVLTAQHYSASADARSLREANAELIHEKSLLEDRLATALADKDQMWETMRQALDNERYAYRTQLNHLVQRSGAGIPYPDAHSIPADAAPKLQKPGPIGRSARVLPSEMAQRNTAAFVHEFVETLGPGDKA